MNIGSFWHFVTVLCHSYDCRVTSGPRSIRWNKEVGGVPTSYHLSGLAADVAGFAQGQKNDLVSFCNRNGVLTVDEGDHIHLQPKN